MAKTITNLAEYLRDQATQLAQLAATAEEGCFRVRTGLGTSDPPTAGELTAAFGAPAALPEGFRAVVESATNRWYIVYAVAGTWQALVAGAGGVLLWNTPYPGLVPLGHVIWFEYQGLAGATVSILPPGAMLAQVVDVISSTVVASNGNTHNARTSTGYNAGLRPGGAALTIYNDGGGNTVTLLVTAGGDATIQRTGGVLTYDVALNLLWL
jgi:S1-C subfamily serine protease